MGTLLSSPFYEELRSEKDELRSQNAEQLKTMNAILTQNAEQLKTMNAILTQNAKLISKRDQGFKAMMAILNQNAEQFKTLLDELRSQRGSDCGSDNSEEFIRPDLTNGPGWSRKLNLNEQFYRSKLETLFSGTELTHQPAAIIPAPGQPLSIHPPAVRRLNRLRGQGSDSGSDNSEDLPRPNLTNGPGWSRKLNLNEQYPYPSNLELLRPTYYLSETLFSGTVVDDVEAGDCSDGDDDDDDDDGSVHG